MRYLAEALDRFVDFTTRDTASLLAKERALLGLSCLLKACDCHGIPKDDLYLVALPDFTYTRNNNRWKDGFAYGCLIVLPQGEPNSPILPLGFRANCCGVTLGSISSAVGQRDVLQELSGIADSYEKMSSDDMGRGNHFLSVLRERATGEHVVLLHGSFDHVKGDANGYPGLYLERSPHWRSRIQTVTIGDFRFNYLLGQDVQEYANAYIVHEQFTKRMRAMIIKELFPECEIIFNETHEGLFSNTCIVLGAYISERPFSCPIMQTPETDVQLVRVTKCISALANVRLPSDLYVCPHGGGYTLNMSISAVEKTNGSYGRAVSSVTLENKSRLECTYLSGLPFKYRTNVASIWCEALGAGQVVADLVPELCIKP